jgi:peptide/nickel transport system substrate-binding protein
MIEKGERGRAFLTVIAVLAVGACGGGKAGPPAADAFCASVLPKVDSFEAKMKAEHPTPKDPRYGGTVVVGTIGELTDGMNSLVSSDFASTQHQDFLNQMTLIQYDDSLRPVPYLAKSWDVSPDDTEITFHLRHDVYWQDGVKTTARDVAFTYERATDSLTGFPNPAFWDRYVKGPAGVEVLDDYTIRIHMKPQSDFLDPWRSLAIMPAHLLQDVPPQELKTHPFNTQCPVGNGPFVFIEHKPQDRWVFGPNYAFPQALGGRPFVDRYVYRIIPEQTTLLTDLLTGGIDIYVSVPPSQAKKVKDDPDLRLIHFPFRNYVFVAWNSRRPQLADPRVRRAITMATNRKEIVQSILQGYGTVANSTVPPFHWAYDPAAAGGLPYDTVAAKKLLTEAGWIDRNGDGVRENAQGVPLAFTIKYNKGNQAREDIAEIMQSQLAKVGIKATPQVVEWSTLIDQITSPKDRDFDGVVMSMISEFKLDDTDLFASWRLDQPYAWSGTHNPTIDTLLRELAQPMDRAKAKPLWVRYQRALAQEQPYTFFYFPDRLEGVNKRVENVTMDARSDWVNTKDWWIDPAKRH